MSFHRISRDNGLWQKLLLEWEEECAEYGENLSEYALASIPTVRPLAEESQIRKSGVYGLAGESRYLALCQLNVDRIPGYDNKVLRVRHTVVSPKFDFDDQVTTDEYVDAIASLLIGVLDVSDGEMSAPYVKYHFRSPTERGYFKEFEAAAKRQGVFASIQMQGNWLYIAKLRESGV